MDYARIARELAAHIRSAVRPQLGTAESRRVMGTASSGDATFSIDELAERAVINYIETNRLPLAYYTEDAGLRIFGEPEACLVIDPVDGSRGAIAGFESCVVSVAVADYSPEGVRMRNVRAGCIFEIKNDRVFIAERGHGARVFCGDVEVFPQKLDIVELSRAGWTAEIAGRPPVAVASVLAEAINASSIRGGFFIWNSTAYSLTRLVSGQLAAVVDIGGRLLRDAPATRDEFLSAGFGQVMGLFPYDIAAAALIAQEAGCTVTDAWGNSLDDIDLLDSSESNILSIVAACTEELHTRFMEAIKRGFDSLIV